MKKTFTQFWMCFFKLINTKRHTFYRYLVKKIEIIRNNWQPKCTIETVSNATGCFALFWLTVRIIYICMLLTQASMYHSIFTVYRQISIHSPCFPNKAKQFQAFDVHVLVWSVTIRPVWIKIDHFHHISNVQTLQRQLHAHSFVNDVNECVCLCWMWWSLVRISKNLNVSHQAKIIIKCTQRRANIQTKYINP